MQATPLVPNSPPPSSALGNRRGSLKMFAELKSMQDAQAEAVESMNTTKVPVLRQFLKDHTVEELDTPKQVIEVVSSLTPEEGFKILTDNNILGAPVWDEDSQRYFGFLDVRDLVSSVVAKNKAPTFNATSCYNTIFQKPGDNINLKYLATRHPFVPVKEHATLLDVAAVLSGVSHRVPVVGQDGRCKTIVSQSTLLDFVANKHFRDLDQGELNLTLKELETGIKKVQCVSDNTPALDTFKLMDDLALSGIGVVEQQTNLLIGNTSARDIKHFLANQESHRLELPILDYLAQARQEGPAKARHPICKVQHDASLGKIIKRLGATRYHRVFVTDVEGLPIGVVSLSDIMRLVCGKAPKDMRQSLQAEKKN